MALPRAIPLAARPHPDRGDEAAMVEAGAADLARALPPATTEILGTEFADGE